MKVLLALPFLLAGCGSQEAAAPPQNGVTRQSEMLVTQAAKISAEAEKGTATIERALENESAIVFENRGNLLNEAAGAPAEPSNRRR